MPLLKALATAREKGVDLVEVAPTAEPSVCRLMDYGKFKYEQAKKEKDARRSQKAVIVRDLRLRPKINEHDLETKIQMVKNFLSQGNKVKVSMRFRGRENAHPELGLKILKNLSLALKDVGTLEAPPAIGSNEMSILIQSLPSKKQQEAKPAKIKQEAKTIQVKKEVNA